MIEPVSVDSLRKTGIFADTAGDFLRFSPQARQSESPETKAMREKPAPGHSHVSLGTCPTWECLAGAGVFEPRHGELEIGALAYPRGDAQPRSTEVHKYLETFEFRDLYRMDGVQSFGEKRDVRRIIGRLCRSAVRSSDDKSPLLLGLIAREFTRRIHSLSQSGGESDRLGSV